MIREPFAVVTRSNEPALTNELVKLAAECAIRLSCLLQQLFSVAEVGVVTRNQQKNRSLGDCYPQENLFR
jgi:hypothetical protein